MIELLSPDGYKFEEGVNFPVYLPDCAVVDADSTQVSVASEFLGTTFCRDSYAVFCTNEARIVPELPLNQVIGIPSLEGMIFGEHE